MIKDKRSPSESIKLSISSHRNPFNLPKTSKNLWRKSCTCQLLSGTSNFLLKRKFRWFQQWMCSKREKQQSRNTFLLLKQSESTKYFHILERDPFLSFHRLSILKPTKKLQLKLMWSLIRLNSSSSLISENRLKIWWFWEIIKMSFK